MSKKLRFALILLVISHVNGQLSYWNTQSQLHPVQGLYVKPSADGTTGDLYVAATEDSGVNTQWLTDQPVSFLPIAAASQPQPTALPISFASSLTATLPNDESVASLRKRAILPNPIRKPHLGFSGGRNFFYPTLNPTEGSPCVDAPLAASVPQYPYQYLYPQMVPATFANSNVVKETLANDDRRNSMSSHGSPVWPTSHYTYPFQYVIMDPSSWGKSQMASSSPLSTSNDTTITENSKSR